jgi:hypothetical protein
VYKNSLVRHQARAHSKLKGGPRSGYKDGGYERNAPMPGLNIPPNIVGAMDFNGAPKRSPLDFNNLAPLDFNYLSPHDISPMPSFNSLSPNSNSPLPLDHGPFGGSNTPQNVFDEAFGLRPILQTPVVDAVPFDEDLALFTGFAYDLAAGEEGRKVMIFL